MKSMRSLVAARRAIAGFMLIAVSSGCGARSEPAVSSPAGPTGTPFASLSELVDAGSPVEASQANRLFEGDANLVGTTKQPVERYLLRASIKLGAVGVVAGYSEGPNFAEFEGDRGGRTTVMAVRISAILKGAAPASRMVYVQLAAASEPDAAQRAVPIGTAVALLLSAPTMESKVDAAAGRPTGEPVWIAGAQGLIVSNGPGGGVTYPRAGLVDPEVRLDDLVLEGMKRRGQPVTMVKP